ncbi:MAG: hypothetical protein K0R09_896 [Clostridiales bacterium]|nr:hypothetical protein [Clostridiales bacterium]
MRLLYGTSNPSKLQHMREMLEGLNIEIIGLDDVGINIDVDESGTNPLENARAKAMAYYEISGIPTFSCDSGLYIEGLDEEKQPGVHVRRINNRYLNDEEFIEYYSEIVLNIGHDTKAKFKNAICLVTNKNNVVEYDGDDIADHFLMTSKPHNMRKSGFPMDSISLDIETGKYFMDMNEKSRNEKEIAEGFRSFFIRTV